MKIDANIGEFVLRLNQTVFFSVITRLLSTTIDRITQTLQPPYKKGTCP